MCHESVVNEFDAPERVDAARSRSAYNAGKRRGVCQIGEAHFPGNPVSCQQYPLVDYRSVGQNATARCRFARSSLSVTKDALRWISSALILAIEEADACEAARGRDEQFHRVLRHAIELQESCANH